MIKFDEDQIPKISYDMHSVGISRLEAAITTSYF